MGRDFVRVFAVVAMGFGAGLLAWGISSAGLEEPLRAPLPEDLLLGNASEAIGWGVGFLMAGVAALLLALLPPRRRADTPQEAKPDRK